MIYEGPPGGMLESEAVLSAYLGTAAAGAEAARADTVVEQG
jgi:hypothetical protein